MTNLKEYLLKQHDDNDDDDEIADIEINDVDKLKIIENRI